MKEWNCVSHSPLHTEYIFLQIGLVQSTQALMSDRLCFILGFTTPRLWDLGQAISPLWSSLTLWVIHIKVFTSPGFCGEFNKMTSLISLAHTLYVQKILAPILYKNFQRCLATWKCSFPAKSLVFSTTSINANLSPLAILMSSCCSSHLWSKRIQGFSLKKHIQILPQTVSSHIGNWINNSRPPPAFLTPLFLSVLQTCVDWMVSAIWTTDCGVLERVLDWEPRHLGQKPSWPHPRPLLQPVFWPVNQRVLAFLNRGPYPKSQKTENDLSNYFLNSPKAGT